MQEISTVTSNCILGKSSTKKKKGEDVRTQKATGQEIGSTLMPKSIKALADRE